MDPSRERYSRGYLPHIESGDTPQFVTWRLQDANPASAIKRMREEFEEAVEENRRKELQQKIEAYADAGYGQCLMQNPWIAREVQETLFHDHGRSYQLHAWVVMPNHVQVVLDA